MNNINLIDITYRRNTHIITMILFGIIALTTNTHIVDTDTRDLTSTPHPLIVASKNKNWNENHNHLSWNDKIKAANDDYYMGHISYDRSIRHDDEFRWVD